MIIKPLSKNIIYQYTLNFRVIWFEICECSRSLPLTKVYGSFNEYQINIPGREWEEVFRRLFPIKVGGPWSR